MPELHLSWRAVQASEEIFCRDHTPRGKTLAEVQEEHDRNLCKMPKSYQRMVRIVREEAESKPLELIHKGGFKPCLPEEAA